MSQNVYEGLFILDSNAYARDAAAVSGVVSQLIEGHEGEVLASRLWEERRLAYPIDGHKKGTYWLTYFRLDSQRLGEIQRQCNISDDVLRVMFLKVDPRLVDTLVAHATGQVVDEPEPEPVTAAATSDDSDDDE